MKKARGRRLTEQLCDSRNGLRRNLGAREEEGIETLHLEESKEGYGKHHDYIYREKTI